MTIRFALWCLVSVLILSVCNGASADRSPDGVFHLNSSSGDSLTNAFVVFGRITGNGGRPLRGVEMRAWCGNGTLGCTGKTTTDGRGLYRLLFGPGVWFGALAPGGGGVGLQVATVLASKPGYSCADLGRAGNLAMTDFPRTEPAMTRSFAGVLQAGRPYRLDLSLQPAANLAGRLVSVDGRLPAGLTLSVGGNSLPPSSSVLASTQIGAQGTFSFAEVPTNSNWWFEAFWREGDGWKNSRTEPFSLVIARKHRVSLLLTREKALRIEGLK